ncbi:hypothetical protein L2E82_27650 [Cichorium intybus]|uniref:Uncharacterized protein n=1 Tax=Cichorium intybus TaxID=13427 RepID=A0ACB9CTP7_CICIN|nr:hypothetical protein L2E82_27650 [Cichorium intybus]
MASTSNVEVEVDMDCLDESDDDSYEPSLDDFGSDVSMLSLDSEEDENRPSSMDKTIYDPFLNNLVQEEIKLPEIQYDEDEWSPSDNDFNIGDYGDKEAAQYTVHNPKIPWEYGIK